MGKNGDTDDTDVVAAKSFASKVYSLVYAAAFSLAPRLQPGDPVDLFLLQPLKRLGTVELTSGSPG